MYWYSAVGKAYDQAALSSTGVGILLQDPTVEQGFLHLGQSQIIILPFLVSMSGIILFLARNLGFYPIQCKHRNKRENDLVR